MRLVVGHVWTQIFGEFPKDIVDKGCSYLSSGRFFSEAYKEDKWDGRIRLRRRNRIPTGLLPRVLFELERAFIEHTVEDTRQLVVPTPVTKLANGRDLTKPPYDYQAIVVEAACKAGRGIIQAGTGAGKTQMGSAILASYGLPSIWLTDRRFLLHQTRDALAESLGEPVGLLGDGKVDLKKHTVCMVQTLDFKKGREIKKHLQGAQVIVYDECFPAGTLVGERRIEELRVGDLVPSFDECGGVFRPGRVTRLFCKRPETLVRIHHGDGALVATGNHPIWTRRGWVKAADLMSSDEILRCKDGTGSSLLEVQRPYKAQEAWDVRSLFGTAQGEEKAQVGRGMLCLQNSGFACGERSYSSKKEGKGLLFAGMQQEVREHVLCRDYAEDQPSLLFRENEKKQPYASGGSTEEGFNHTQEDWAQTNSSRWEWAWDNGSATAADGGYGVEAGSGGFYKWVSSSYGKVPNPLQARFGRPGPSFMCGGGRRVSSLFAEAGTRPEEGEFSAWVGVDSVEVLERGGDGEFGGLCPGGLVYNIEVEGTHTYVANGVVVHNCHHLASDQWLRISQQIPAPYRFGLSATPCLVGPGLNLVGQTGRILCDIPAKDLIERGVLCQPRVWIVPVPTPNLPKSASWQEAYRTGIVENWVRNQLICDVTATLAKDGKPPLILVKHISHGKHLVELMTQQGVRSAFIQGSTPKEEREAHLSSLQDRHLHGLVAVSSILGEGVDLPWLSAVINATGTKGGGTATGDVNSDETGRETIQIVGRALRRWPGKRVVEVVDFEDVGHRFLSGAAGDRAATYSFLLGEDTINPWAVYSSM